MCWLHAPSLAQQRRAWLEYMAKHCRVTSVGQHSAIEFTVPPELVDEFNAELHALLASEPA